MIDSHAVRKAAKTLGNKDIFFELYELYELTHLHAAKASKAFEYQGDQVETQSLDRSRKHWLLI